MDAFAFFQAVGRMCKVYKGNCENCPLYEKPCVLSLNNIDADAVLETMIEAAEKWAKEYMVKTRKSEFKKIYPGANVDEIFPCSVDSDYRKMCDDEKDSNSFYCRKCKKYYWNKEVF